MSVPTISEKVTVNYTQDKASIRFSGDVNADRIFKLCDEIDFAINYYNYNRIQIDIDSPGGEVKSLKHYIYNLRNWRLQGVTFMTRALTSCCSAGAYMLSFGDIGHRSALPHAMLLYHNARVNSGDRTMTADHCDGLMWNLNATDFGMILMLMEHLHQEIPQLLYKVMTEVLCCLPDEKYGMNVELLENICCGKEKNDLKKIAKATSEPEKLSMRRSLQGLICERLKKKGKSTKNELSENLSGMTDMESMDPEEIYAWIFRKALWFQHDFTKDTYIRPETAIERNLIDKIEKGGF